MSNEHVEKSEKGKKRQNEGFLENLLVGTAGIYVVAFPLRRQSLARAVFIWHELDFRVFVRSPLWRSHYSKLGDETKKIE